MIATFYLPVSYVEALWDYCFGVLRPAIGNLGQRRPLPFTLEYEAKISKADRYERCAHECGSSFLTRNPIEQRLTSPHFEPEARSFADPTRSLWRTRTSSRRRNYFYPYPDKPHDLDPWKASSTDVPATFARPSVICTRNHLREDVGGVTAINDLTQGIYEALRGRCGVVCYGLYEVRPVSFTEKSHLGWLTFQENS